MKLNISLFKIIAIVLAVVIISCKKNSNPSPPVSSQEAAPTRINGQFDAMKEVSTDASNLSSIIYYNFFATCSDTLVSQANPIGTNFGNISVNNINLSKNSYNVPLVYYSIGTPTININGGFNWQIAGDANTNAFSFTNTNEFPHYSGFSDLPDTINILSTNVTFPILHYYGAEKIEVSISLGSGSTPVKSFSPTPLTTNVTFTQNELSNLYVSYAPGSSNNNGQITVNFYRNNFQTINNRIYNFRTFLTVTKLIVCK